MPVSETSGETAALVLDVRLDLKAAAPLLAALRARQTTPLVLDAGQVSHLGALCLQILLASAEEWRRRGQDLTLSAVSSAFSEALSFFGITAEDLQSLPSSTTMQGETR